MRAMKRHVQVACAALITITMCYEHLWARESGAADRAKAVDLAVGTKPECRGRYSVVLPMIDAVRVDTSPVGYEQDIAPRLTGLPPFCASYTRAYALQEHAAKHTSFAP
jgi:hypothetical protein